MPWEGVVDPFSFEPGFLAAGTLYKLCFRDEAPCSSFVFPIDCAAPGPDRGCPGCRVGSVMVMGSVFRGSKATPASWVTLGPQFGMKPAIKCPKPSPIVSAMAELV